ncbi:Two-component system sensor histidine kinase [hydrothermal vent metagenome]|uniref:histidine kinase n=1 Tax=hydrothermal vent metagenome TaxID=652676 RepID=A0A3B0SZE2_9ZZZZ
MVHASDKWISDFELAYDAVFGMTLRQLFKNASLDWEEKVINSLKSLPSTPSIERHITSTGNEEWYEWHIIPWFDDQENSIGAIIQTANVTQRVQHEAQLEKKDLLIKEKQGIAQIGCWEYDAVKDTLNWCATSKTIHEVAEDYIPTIESKINFYKKGHSRNTLSMALDRAMQEGFPWNEKLQFITAKGAEKWVVASGKPIFKNNKYLGLIGTLQDITVQVKSENKIRESEHLLRTLIDNLPLNIFIKDTEGKKILANKSEVAFCGLKNESQILGKDDFSFYDKKTAKKLQKDDLQVLHDLKPIIGKEVKLMKEDGTQAIFYSSKIPLIGKENKAYGLIGFSMDITNLKQKEHELQNVINVASQQNKKLINFAHIVSHNLRSHTANFSMLLNFLVNEKDETEKQKIIKMLTDASDNLLDTLDNLNEVVDINTNSNLEKNTVCLNKKIASVEQNLKTFLINNNAKIVNTISDKVIVNVVPTYIDSILTNFITNAVKYRSLDRNPIIELSAKSENGYTILSITDNGLGIDLKKYGTKLFGMYKTFHDKKDARGIGLYITKNQIEAMNGKVTATSEIGKGTTFKIYFDEKN